MCYAATFNALFIISYFSTIKTLLKRYFVNVYIFIRYLKFSITPFHNNNELFKDSNAFLKPPHTHPILLHLFNQKNPKI